MLDHDWVKSKVKMLAQLNLPFLVSPMKSTIFINGLGPFFFRIYTSSRSGLEIDMRVGQ